MYSKFVQSAVEVFDKVKVLVCKVVPVVLLVIIHVKVPVAFELSIAPAISVILLKLNV
ncbi:hypothetical protein IKS57_05855 [bacterium]|nr:hypothetical protein [bacterium]